MSEKVLTQFKCIDVVELDLHSTDKYIHTIWAALSLIYRAGNLMVQVGLAT